MKVSEVVTYVTTAKFILGVIAGALASAGIIGPDWHPLLSALFGGTAPSV